MRSLSAAVNVRRRGRSTSSGDAAGGAETSVGLRPSSFSAPPAAKGSLAVVRGMTISMFHLTPSRVNFRGVDVSSSLAQRGHLVRQSYSHQPERTAFLYRSGPSSNGAIPL